VEPIQTKSPFDELIDELRKSSMVNGNSHIVMAEIYMKRHRLLGVFVVITTSLVGTGVFASLARSPVLAVQVITAILSVVAVVLAALQTFLGYADLHIKHKIAGVEYAHVESDLRVLIAKYSSESISGNSSAIKEFEEIKKRFDELGRNSPTVPIDVWNKVWDEVEPIWGTRREIRYYRDGGR
jgi:hypothetical protein